MAKGAMSAAAPRFGPYDKSWKGHGKVGGSVPIYYEVSVCYCGMEEEDLHHVLWVCPLYEQARCEMLDGIGRAEPGPIYYGDLVSSPANFDRLRDFAHAWHAARSEMEREEAVHSGVNQRTPPP